jgi:hypothetical protein
MPFSFILKLMANQKRSGSKNTWKVPNLQWFAWVLVIGAVSLALIYFFILQGSGLSIPGY